MKARAVGLLLDRLGLLVPRLAAVGAGNELAAVDALTDLRIGVNMVDLQRDRDALPPAVRVAVDKVLFGTASALCRAGGAGTCAPAVARAAARHRPRAGRSHRDAPAPGARVCCCNWWASDAACSPMPRLIGHRHRQPVGAGRRAASQCGAQQVRPRDAT